MKKVYFILLIFWIGVAVGITAVAMRPRSIDCYSEDDIRYFQAFSQVLAARSIIARHNGKLSAEKQDYFIEIAREADTGFRSFSDGDRWGLLQQLLYYYEETETEIPASTRAIFKKHNVYSYAKEIQDDSAVPADKSQE